jgi:group I intron endonuclease
MVSGVYCICSKRFPSRDYIGSAVNLELRKKRHFRDLRKNLHHNAKLQAHANKYGVSDLFFIVLVYCPAQYIIQEEQFWIDTIHPYFNINPVAGNRQGARHSNQTKIKISRMILNSVKEKITSRYRRLMFKKHVL